MWLPDFCLHDLQAVLDLLDPWLCWVAAADCSFLGQWCQGGRWILGVPGLPADWSHPLQHASRSRPFDPSPWSNTLVWHTLPLTPVPRSHSNQQICGGKIPGSLHKPICVYCTQSVAKWIVKIAILGNLACTWTHAPRHWWSGSSGYSFPGSANRSWIYLHMWSKRFMEVDGFFICAKLAYNIALSIIY